MKQNMMEPFASAARLATRLQRQTADLDVWQAFDAEMQSAFGHLLFTILAYDAERARMRRVYSSRPSINPVGGSKAVTDSYWTRHVLHEGQIFVGSDKADIARVFSDHELLASNGCDSVMNVPVRRAGRTIGTINLLHGAGRYDAIDGAAALIFAQMAVDPLSSLSAVLGSDDGDESALERV